MNGILTEKPLNALRTMLFIDFWNFTLSGYDLPKAGWASIDIGKFYEELRRS